MKQETIQQSREQLEKAFSSLGSNNKSANHTLYIILFAVAMLLVGIIIGGVVAYDIADSTPSPSKEQAEAENLQNQIAAIDSAGQVSVVINDTTYTYLVIKKDSTATK